MKLKAKTELAKKIYKGKDNIELEESTNAPIDYK